MRAARRHTGTTAKTFDGVAHALGEWLMAQPLFCVATAPLSADGFVNTSPKGNRREFVVITPPSRGLPRPDPPGLKTIAHLRENGRIVILFFAVAAAPRIVRLHGRGRVVERHDPDFALFAEYFPTAHDVGVRVIIVIDVERVSDSCGYGVGARRRRAPSHDGPVVAP